MAEANKTMNNYTLIELLHLTYLMRDSLEYCHAQINVAQETFERRAAMSKSMLQEGNFVERWLHNHPNNDVKAYYDRFANYFKSIYEEENYVSFTNYKVDEEKIADFVEETITNYQITEDILKAFLTEYKKTPGTVEKVVERCLDASFDYYRVVCNWLFFNQVIKCDTDYKKAMRASNNQPSYEVNYNLNILKRLIGGFNFNRDKYQGDKVDIKQMFADTFQGFRALDGTLFKEIETNQGKTLTNEERAAVAKEAIERAATDCVNAIKVYEAIWKETYQEVVNFMKENPINQAPKTTGEEQA